MPLDADNASYLWDMLDAARAVGEFVSNRTIKDYQQDRMLRGVGGTRSLLTQEVVYTTEINA